MEATFVPTGDDHRVTTLELLFDLVFVYALTAVSGTVVRHLSRTGVAEGLVLMALIWFAWAAYSWLGNQARADEGPLRLAMYLAMASFFLVALTIHSAFDERSGGLRGPVVFVVAYGFIRLAHLIIYWVAAGNDHDLRRTITLALGTTLVTLAVLVAGSFLHPHLRLWVWLVAVLIDYVGIFFGAAEGWRVLAPSHFAERHALVIIIAIGESLVSVASAVTSVGIAWRLVVGALLGAALAIMLWRTYFNAIAVAVEDALRDAEGAARTRMARDVFTYLHLPAVVGIVGIAVGLNVTLSRVGRGTDALPGVAVATLYGGAAIYLLTLSALRWRVLGAPSVPRTLTAGWLIAAGVVLRLSGPPPLVDAAVVTGTFFALVTFDAWKYGEKTRAMRLEDA